MKRLCAIVLAAAMAASLAACSGNRGEIVDVRTPQPDSIIVAVPTDVPDVTPEPTPAPTPVPTEAPTAGPTEQSTEQASAEPTQGPDVTPDQSVFDDAVFIGNSIFEGLYRFGIITHGKFFTKVGLNVNSVMTDHAEGGTVPVIDELKDGSYGKVILLLGTNELGWPSYSAFIQKYSELLDAVWQRQPSARIYITALPPVTKEVSDTSTNGITNANITKMNGMLRELAERRGAVYIDVPDSLYDSSMSLPAEASSDGIHLNLKYDRLWADHITLKVMGRI